ncbi:hypothetical protein J2N67_006275 (plasmid) [Bacillus thuringiensis]|uniref:hypothetical protein n=1 Tax=Bacillus thuringiensis TaxID=1428 RepID=UPI00208FEBC6|nr:hypothetical protein [Bacillus thuringiensis]MDA2150777.1 hypothetical protein [Bacillus cereus]USP56026.1 hypothetical protein J2N67_006275 [Bacillus thuringiensis]
MNAEEKNSEMRRLKEEIKNIWFSLWIASCFVSVVWWFLEPRMEEIINFGEGENEVLTLVSNIFFDYFLVGIYYIGLIIGLIAIFKKKKAIRRYKKEKNSPSKINMQKDDINQNPVYVIDHSKDKKNRYEKGDRDMMKRVFNQNNNVSTNLGKQNTNKTRGKGSPIRSYNGSTHSSNSTESNDINNIVLGVALGSSIYSSGDDNNCSQPDSSSIGDSGPSCD